MGIQTRGMKKNAKVIKNLKIDMNWANPVFLTETEIEDVLSMSGISGVGLNSVHEYIEALNEEYVHEQIFHSAVESDYSEPKTWKQMLKRPPEEVKKWMEGVQKEFDDFKRRKVWKIVKIKDIPKGRNLIGSK